MKSRKKHKKTNKQKQTLQKLLLNRKFLARISEVRIAYAIPNDHGFSNDENVRKWNRRIISCFTKKSKGLTLSNAIDALMRDFGSPASYRISLINFVFFNKLTTPGSPIVVHLKWNEKTKQPECMIQIFGDTTLEDIKDIWGREIKEIRQGKGLNIFRKPLPLYAKKYKYIFNLERDAEIRRLREDEHFSLRDVSAEMSQRGYKVDYNNIPNIISRFKRNIGEEK